MLNSSKEVASDAASTIVCVAEHEDFVSALNVDDTLPAALMQNFEKAVSAGYGDQELSAIFEVLLPKSE